MTLTAARVQGALRRRYRRLRNRPAYWAWRRFVVTQSMRLLRARASARFESLTYPKVFIIGAARSGTTWVNEMLERHPDVITEAESHAYQDVFRPVVESRGSSQGWAEVLVRDDQARRKDIRLRIKRYVDRRTLRRLVARAMSLEVPPDEAAEWLIGAIFDHFYVSRGGNGHEVLVEKSPGHTPFASRILDRHAEAKAIEMVRDGRDVAVSKHMKRVARGHSAVSWTAAERDDRIGHWVKYIRMGQALRADPRYANRVLQVRYEDMRADPRGGLARVLDFVGLPHTPELIERVVAETDFSAFANTGDGQHRRKGVAGGWREHFSDDDRRRFAELAGDELMASGYDRE